MVERHLALARHLADRVDAAPELERLADVPLNIVCFRAHPDGLDDAEELDALNRGSARRCSPTGASSPATTVYGGQGRPAPGDRQLADDQKADVELLVDVVRELVARLV